MATVTAGAALPPTPPTPPATPADRPGGICFAEMRRWLSGPEARAWAGASGSAEALLESRAGRLATAPCPEGGARVALRGRRISLFCDAHGLFPGGEDTLPAGGNDSPPGTDGATTGYAIGDSAEAMVRALADVIPETPGRGRFAGLVPLILAERKQVPGFVFSREPMKLGAEELARVRSREDLAALGPLAERYEAWAATAPPPGHDVSTLSDAATVLARHRAALLRTRHDLLVKDLVGHTLGLAAIAGLVLFFVVKPGALPVRDRTEPSLVAAISAALFAVWIAIAPFGVNPGELIGFFDPFRPWWMVFAIRLVGVLIFAYLGRFVAIVVRRLQMPRPDAPRRRGSRAA